MTTPMDPPQSDSTYIIDAENAAEMARLTKQDRLLSKAKGGLFPEQCDLSKVQRVLDIACGPGGWVLDVARTYPDKQVEGIDISKLMIEYARYQAQVQGLNNVRFNVMNVLEPLDFPANSFNLVNARLIATFLPTAAWPQLLQECLRITKSGGSICLSECEMPITNSSAFEKMNSMVFSAIQVSKQSFSPGKRNIGTTSVLGRLLRNAGYQHVQQKAYAVDFSAGTEAYISTYQDWMVVFKLMQPFLIKMGATTHEEVDQVYQQLLAEMLSDDFCAIWFFLSIWGEKPQ